MESGRTSRATELMMRFADRTGLTSSDRERRARRYLWTDAFAVCNFLALSQATGDRQYDELALRLVDQVHHHLGRYRVGDRRTGWLSGLPDREAEAHPTRGGLRIGKPLPERGPMEPVDLDLEWERDGQYFHYLTKWMHALDQMARWTSDAKFNVWARELAQVAHRAFTYDRLGAKRMFWKLSVDLSRPVVPSMGQHDPLDGLVTCAQLETTAALLRSSSTAGPRLASAAADFAGMIERAPDLLATSDPLGLGGLLFDAGRLVQVGAYDDHEELIRQLLTVTVIGLRRYVTETDLRDPPHVRLPFRELGLAAGLAGVSLIEASLPRDRLALFVDRSAGKNILTELKTYVPLREEIESFWLQRSHQRAATWVEHADINDVMLATSLLPEGFLTLGLGRSKATSSVEASPSSPALGS